MRVVMWTSLGDLDREIQALGDALGMTSGAWLPIIRAARQRIVGGDTLDMATLRINPIPEDDGPRSDR